MEFLRGYSLPVNAVAMVRKQALTFAGESASQCSSSTHDWESLSFRALLKRCYFVLSFLLDSLRELFYSFAEHGIPVHALLSAAFSKLRRVNVARSDLGSGCPTVLEAVLPIVG